MKQKNNIWVADFETITAETNYFKKYNKTGIVYGYLENLYNENLNHQFISIAEMLHFFTLRRVNHIIYFHNLSFDGVFILDWLGKNGYTLTDELEKEGHFSVFRTTGSKIYKIEMLFLPKGCKNPRKISFQCSKMILSSSVKALGKNVKISKFAEGEEEDENFYNREPENSLVDFYFKNTLYCEYCKRDVKIVIAALKDFFESIRVFLAKHDLEDNMIDVQNCITISGISLLLQRLMIEKIGMNPQDIYLQKLQDRIIMDQFTNGGLTINNYEYMGQDLQNVVGETIDLKSAYPAVMHDELPYGDLLYEKPEGDYVEFQEIHYDFIAAKNHKIPLLKNWNHKVGEVNYFLECSDYTTYLLKEEAETIEKLYYYTGKTIKNRYYFKKKAYLTTFIDEMFYYKEKYKKENELGKSHTFKILLNSGYGIHAKRFDFRMVLPFCAMDIIEKKKVEYKVVKNINLNEPHRHSYIPNNLLEVYEPILEGDIAVQTSHKGIANYITAKTRIKLMEGILHFGPKNFVYCDTDSLFLINLKREYIKEYCGDKLGDWEIEEKSFDAGYFLRPKLYETYRDGKKVKSGSAGIDKSKLDIKKIQQLHEVNIEKAVLIPLRVDGGIILQPADKMIKLNYEKIYHKQKITKDMKDYIDNINERLKNGKV